MTSEDFKKRMKSDGIDYEVGRLLSKSYSLDEVKIDDKCRMLKYRIGVLEEMMNDRYEEWICELYNNFKEELKTYEELINVK